MPVDLSPRFCPVATGNELSAFMAQLRTPRPSRPRAAPKTAADTFAQRIAELERETQRLSYENARLSAETREAFAHQTATADILRAISRSPTNVQPVFDA